MRYNYNLYVGVTAVECLSICVLGWHRSLSTPVQELCLQSNIISICLEQLDEPNSLLKQWLAICLGRLWRKYDAARWCGVRDSAHEKLYNLLWDEVPDVSVRRCDGRWEGCGREGRGGGEGRGGEGGGGGSGGRKAMS